MDILIRYGFSIEEIKNMIDSNPDINNVDDSVIYNDYEDFLQRTYHIIMGRLKKV